MYVEMGSGEFANDSESNSRKNPCFAPMDWAG